MPTSFPIRFSTAQISRNGTRVEDVEFEWLVDNTSQGRHVLHEPISAGPLAVGDHSLTLRAVRPNGAVVGLTDTIRITVSASLPTATTGGTSGAGSGGTIGGSTVAIGGTGSGTGSGQASAGGPTSGTATAGEASGGGFDDSGLKLLDGWMVEIRRPRKGANVRLRNGSVPKVAVRLTTQGPTALRVRSVPTGAVQVAVLKSASSNLTWKSAVPRGKVNKRGQIRFVVLGAGSNFVASDPLTVLARASTNFAVATSPTARVEVTGR